MKRNEDNLDFFQKICGVETQLKFKDKFKLKVLITDNLLYYHF